MRFCHLLLLTAVAGPVLVLPALAQDAGLRGTAGANDALTPATVDQQTTGTVPSTIEPDEADTGSARPEQRVLRGPEPDDVAEGSTVAAAPRSSDQEEADPFAAVGIRKGSFILYPSLTTSIEHRTNDNGDGPTTDLDLTPELRVISDWAEHEATLTLRGSYEKQLHGPDPDSPSGLIEGTGRIDLHPDWALNLDGRYEYEQQETSDPDFPAGVDNRPGVHDFFGSAMLRGRVGRGVFEAEGSTERALYDNGVSGGVPVDQSYRDNSVYDGRVRLGYDAGLGITPFVEGELARQVYDQEFDNFGLRRSNIAAIGRIGLAIDRGPVLAGDVSIGYGTQVFDDPALEALRALTFDGSLVWSPTRLFTVTVDATTTFSPSTDPAVSGSVIHDVTVDAAYALKHNFVVDWTAEFNHEVFHGTGQVDTTITAGIAATWKLNRGVFVTGSYAHEWDESTDAASRFETDILKLGLRLQR